MLFHWLLLARAASNPEVYADQYLVIVATESDPAALAPIRERLAAVEVEPVELVSSDFAGLRPCLSLLVANAFPSKDEAVRYAARLAEAGVEGEVRPARGWVGDDPHRADQCRPDAVWLPVGDTMSLGNTDRVGDGPIVSPWMRGVGLGQTFRVVSLPDGESRECTVSGFEARYLWNGCSVRELVATFDGCAAGDLVVPAGAPPPRVYRETSDARGVDLPGLKAELRRRAGHGGTLDTTLWDGPGGKVVYLQLTCEDDGCAEPQQTSWAVRVGEGGRADVLPLAHRRDASLVAMVDLGADGLPEGVFETGTCPRKSWVEGLSGEIGGLMEPVCGL